MATRTKADDTLQRKKALFLEAYALCGNITRAAEQIGVTRQAHYEWLKDEGYARKFGDATEMAGDRLEEEARRRAVDGVEEPVFYLGEQVSTVRKYSDTLLIFLLKGARPTKYRERGQIDVKVEAESLDQIASKVMAANGHGGAAPA